jgi:hypothetical protein
MNVENDPAIINSRSRDDHLLLFFKRGLVNGYYFSREDNWDYILKPFSSELNDLTQLLVSVFIRILGILSKPLIRFRDWTPMDNISLFIA